MDQLHEKTVWERCLRMRRKHGLGWFDDAAASPQQPVRHDVRGAAPGPAVDDALGDPPEVLDEHDAQGGRHRPQFANAQRLHFLIGAQVAAQHLRVEEAVGVGHVRPGHAEHARIPHEGSAGELGQLSIVAGR
jgi:hypothetical protein